MNEFFTQLQKMARTIRLSHDEKQAMRVQLYTYFEQNPARGAAPSNVARSVPSPYFFFSPRFSMPFAALLLLIISGGTTFAAKGSLPGDALYSVKINVNERVATALATSPEAKAQINAALATTRLEEAESLASSGKLDGKASAALATNFSMHVSAAQNNTMHLESKDPGTAAQLGAEFDSTLAAHGAILAQLGDDSSSSETTHNSNSLAARVRESQRGDDPVLAIAADDSVRNQRSDDTPGVNAKVSSSARAKTIVPTAPNAPQATAMSFTAASTGVATTDASTSASAPQPVAKVMTKAAKTKASTTEQSNSRNPKDAQIAASLALQASTSLNASIKDFAALTTLDSNTSALIKTQIANAQSLYVSASASLSAGDISTAKDGFSRVLRMSVKLDAYLKAGKKFNYSLLSALLGVVPSKDDSKGNSSKTPATTTKQSSGKIKGVATTSASTSHDTSVEASSSSSSENDSSGKGGSEETSGKAGSFKDAIKARLHW